MVFLKQIASDSYLMILSKTEVDCLKKRADNLGYSSADLFKMHIEALLVCLGAPGFVSLDKIDKAMAT